MGEKTIEIKGESPGLKELLSMIETGTEVILTRGETPVARLVPVRSGSGPRIPGLHKGILKASDDFDAPLPDSFWTGAG